MSRQSVGLNLLARVVMDGRLGDFLLLKREYFYEQEVVAFDWIRSHHERHGVLPSFELTKRRTPIKNLDGDDPYGVWYDEYANRALYNRFQSFMPELNRMLTQRRTGEALDLTSAFVTESMEVRADQQRDLFLAPQVGADVLAEYRKLRDEFGMSGVPSGWPTLDHMSHGFQNGDLIVFAARPGIGKSSVMVYLAEQAHRNGFIPMFVTMEMKRVQIGGRLFALHSGVSMTSLRAGELTTEAERRLEAAIEDYREPRHPFYFVEGHFRKNFNELAALIHSHRPGIVFVDGAYLLKVPSMHPRMARWEQVSLIAEALKDIALKNNIPVVASFQITREGGQKIQKGQKIGVEYLQLADTIGQLASLAVGIFEEEGSDNPDADRQRKLGVLKGREGESGEWYINWLWDRMNFDEIQDPMSELESAENGHEGENANPNS